MLEIFIYFLLFIVPGFIAVLVFELATRHRIRACCRNISTALIFDLLIFLINIAGLFIFKSINELRKLKWYFDCISFTCKYALLSIVVGILLALIAGLFIKLCHKKKIPIANNNTI